MGNTLRQSWRRSKVLVAGILALAASVSIACYWRVGDRATLPGALPFDPEHNPGSTEAYLRSLDFSWANGPPGRWRGYLTCHPASDCNSAPRVEFQITAEKDARTTPMVDALGGPRPEKGGYIVAQLINLDPTHEYRPFGMSAKDTAYLWVGPTKNGSKRFAIYRLRRGESPRLLARAGRANFCPVGTRPVTDIHPPTECPDRRRLYGTDSTTLGSAAAFGSTSLLRLAAATAGPHLSVTSMSHADGLWVSCSGGCCEAGDWAIF